MRAKFLQDIIDETPKDVEIFMRWYADLTVRITQLLNQKGISQKELAEALGKKPSEISKWLNGEHNFTLRSLAKLEAELGEELLTIPSPRLVEHSLHGSVKMVVLKNTYQPKKTSFESFKINPHKKRYGLVS